MNNEAYDWLIKVGTKLWRKHTFSYYTKCDVLMNNLCDAFNSTILCAREKWKLVCNIVWPFSL